MPACDDLESLCRVDEISAGASELDREARPRDERIENDESL
jgi:hypothetical protein